MRCYSLRTTLLLTLLAFAACGGGDDAAAPDAGTALDATEVDLSAPLFAPDHVVEVDIELADADWNQLCGQSRSVASLFGSCLSEPFEDPYTYFSATVTIDGETLQDVGVRKKGFLGSLDAVKPSLKLKFDEYVNGQRLAGLENFTLNNAKQDPAYVRQCLSYQTFTAAGIPASRCNFAHVTVNGVDLGVYVHVESASKDFLRRHFDDDEGNLYEGTLSDFRDGWTATFELKTNETANDRSDLDAVIAALEQPDSQLLDALEPVVDVDQFLRFWATEILVTHWDGYAGNANNFYAYHDPSTGKFSFAPWGVDSTFNTGGNPFGGSGGTAVQANSLLPRRLYLLPETRDRYLTTLRSVLAGSWDEGDLLAEIDRIEALISPFIADTEQAGFATNLDAVRDFVRTRRGAIETALSGGPPVWDAPLRGPPCFETIGDLAGTFETTWGTSGAADPFATGTGTLTGTIDGVAIATLDVGATSGMDPDVQPPDPPRAQVAQVSWLTDGTADIVVFQIDPALFQPNATLPIDWVGVLGVIYHYTPSTGAFELVGLFANGTLELAMASTTDGGPVTGSFSGDVIRSPF